ncbi:MAG TPA: hypothetical protein VFT55_02625 [Planctomycetota bacterium]|nr:hypothetical protein [Planctomycetota bacterium]
MSWFTRLTGVVESSAAAAGTAAMRPTRTMHDTDLGVYWRRKVAPVFVARALMACR